EVGDLRPVGLRVVGRMSLLMATDVVAVERTEDLTDHGQAAPSDLTPPACIDREPGRRPRADLPPGGEAVVTDRHGEHDRPHGRPDEAVLGNTTHPASQIDIGTAPYQLIDLAQLP